ncbi:hypothetical protein R1flu_001206 [Riccia fluitans]|uniref:Tubulin-specific chaperone A n=1 Tax=Riccia fluitans TaxID=41844 RepID=A0ABD1Y2Z2_9MARC
MASQELKTLKIRIGVCKRLLKELQSYESEVERETAKTQKMKDNNADAHDIKQQENVLSESKMMIPDCRKRLETALAQLETSLASINEDLEKEEDVTAARQLVTNAQSVLEVA